MSTADVASCGYCTDVERVTLVPPTAYTYSTVVGLIAATALGAALMVTLRPSMSVTVRGYVVTAGAVASAAGVSGAAAVGLAASFSPPPHAAAKREATRLSPRSVRDSRM